MQNIQKLLLIIFLLGSMLIPLLAEESSLSYEYIHKESESFKAKFIRFAISLIGMKNKIEKDFLSGSIEQTPKKFPNSLKSKYGIEELNLSGRKIWNFIPIKSSSVKTIIYLHGGAYIYNVDDIHWDLVKELLKKTNANIVVPDYPLAPAHTVIDSMEFMSKLYKNVLKKTKSENIIFMGDSAGAGLALGFALQLKKEKIPMPDKIILLSPWLDVTMSNSDILLVDEDDKILGIKGLQLAGKAYSGEVNERDFKVSPIYGELAGLPKISIFISTYDLFIADCRKFKEMLKKESVPYQYFEYPKLFHDWVVITGLAESEHAVGEIVKLVGE